MPVAPVILPRTPLNTYSSFHLAIKYRISIESILHFIMVLASLSSLGILLGSFFKADTCHSHFHFMIFFLFLLVINLPRALKHFICAVLILLYVSPLWLDYTWPFQTGLSDCCRKQKVRLGILVAPQILAN